MLVVARTLNKTQSTVFTLHDCIVTTEENLEFLESFMKETFTVTIGFAQFQIKVQCRICRMFVKVFWRLSEKHIISRKRFMLSKDRLVVLDEKTVLSKNPYFSFFVLSFSFLT
jgi:hypothetical protein